jgi:uncharacterized RDD family membrane protein YckC
MTLVDDHARIGRSGEGRVGPPAPLWRRVLARLVDGVTVFFVLWALVVLQVFWFMRDLSVRVDVAPWARALGPLLVYLVLAGAYEVVFLAWNNGQTPGKQLLRVRVVRGSDGRGVSAGRAALRWVLPGAALLVWPPLAGLAVVGMTGVSAPLNRQRRALHDLLAGSIVVNTIGDDREPDDDRSDGRDERDDDDELATVWESAGMTQVLFGGALRRPHRERGGRAPDDRRADPAGG